MNKENKTNIIILQGALLQDLLITLRLSSSDSETPDIVRELNHNVLHSIESLLEAEAEPLPYPNYEDFI